MYKKICVTNRKLTDGGDCRGLLRRLDEILQEGPGRPSIVILREKDLSEREYEELAASVLAKCRAAGVPCYFNDQTKLAQKLGADGLQLSFSSYMETSVDNFSRIPAIGVSVHSAAEAEAAAARGADFVIYGNVFETDCKPGLSGRGLDALGTVCATAGRCTGIPVYAIGGISDKNAESCVNAGAAGVCMMSGYMKS